MSADVKQQVKRSAGLSYKEVPSKLEIQGKKGVYFLFDSGLHYIHLNIVCWEQGGGWGGCLMDKIR